MYKEVIFDIETQKLFDQIENPRNLADLEVSVVSAYKRTLNENLEEVEGEMGSFWHPSISEKMGRNIKELWSWLVDADRVVGFNTLKFDVPILAPHFEGDLGRLPHFDILDEVKNILGHRLSLDAIARETLGRTKVAGGLDAVDWWQAGDDQSLAKLCHYCEMDVMVTRDIYDFGLKNKRLKFKNKWNEIKEMVVDFSYPEKVEEPQLGLF